MDEKSRKKWSEKESYIHATSILGLEECENAVTAFKNMLEHGDSYNAGIFQQDEALTIDFPFVIIWMKPLLVDSLVVEHLTRSPILYRVNVPVSQKFKFIIIQFINFKVYFSVLY